MKALTAALKAILASRNFEMEELITITLTDGTVLRYTNGQEPIAVGIDGITESEPIDDEYAQTITIDHTKVAANLTDFPVPIAITDSANTLFSKALASGYDIWFSDADGNILDYERSVWDPTNHLAVFYVRVPTLSSSEDTVIYMYYGDSSHTEDQQNAAGVWDANYLAVYHFEDDPSVGTLKDSTVNAKNGTMSGSMTASRRVSATLGRGWQFDGLNDYVTVPALWSATPTEVSWEMLCKAANAMALGMVPFGSWTTYLWLSTILNGSGTLTVNKIEHSNYPSLSTAGTTAYPVTAERAIAMTALNGGYFRNYVDGAEITPATSMTTISGGASSDGVMIAHHGSNWFAGLLSELRISKAERSAAWIQTTYNSLMSNSTFLTISDDN